MTLTCSNIVPNRSYVIAYPTTKSTTFFLFVTTTRVVVTSPLRRLRPKSFRVAFIGQCCFKTLINFVKRVIDASCLVASHGGIWCLCPLSSSSRFLIVGALTLWVLVSVDYVSKWVEAMVSKNNNHKTVLKFLKENIFSHFGTPKANISDQGVHFCNHPSSF